MTLGDELFRDLDELLARILQQAKGDVGRNCGAVSTEKPPYRLVQVFPLQIPERYIHCTHGRGPGACLRARIEPIEKVMPVTLSGQRVLAGKQRLDFSIDKLFDCKPLDRSREAVPCHAGAGLHSDEHDLAHDRLVQQGYLCRDAMGTRADARDLHKSSPFRIMESIARDSTTQMTYCVNLSRIPQLRARPTWARREGEAAKA